MRKRYFAAAAILFAAASGPAAAQKYVADIQPSTPLPAFCAGRTTTVTVALGNKGSGPGSTWTTDIYHLRYHWMQGAVPVIYDGLRTSLPSNVPAGGHATVSATVQAPSAPGTYQLVFDMAADGVGWFEWFGSKTWSQTVTVQSVASCAVSASTQAMPSALLTKIDGCFPGTKPGLFVVCWGQNFGATKGSGKILMKGLPSGDVILSNQPNLKWNDTSFYAEVPGDLGGFRKGQKVSIQVVTAQNRTSNNFTIGIDPVLDVVSISNGVASSCAGSHDNTCSVGHDMYGQYWHRGDHSNHGAFPSGDSGTDVWKFTLANDWVTDHLDFHDGHPGQSKATGFSPGASNMTISVSWSYDWGVGGTWEAYDMNVWAIGPRGVPYK